MGVEKRERALRSDSLRNRDAILEAAADCLTANPNASLADIAQAAGIARITLYGHFASRSDLLTNLPQTGRKCCCQSFWEKGIASTGYL